MAFWGRTKSTVGGDNTRTSLAAATTINVPDDSNLFYLTGTATVTSLLSAKFIRNRIVEFVQSDSGTTTFTNTNGATVEGTMDLGGSNIALAQDDVLRLLCRADGTWLRLSNTDN